ncbi:hypothetical protein K439DRAFT_1635790 [Ramaria rubella]|nr:hypothetical protein K439DRAFT_1635790 [Ramaria rubella]
MLRAYLIRCITIMPGPKKPLPADFEENPSDNKKIRCVPCMTFKLSPDDEDGGWISRACLFGHIKGKYHLTNQEQYAREKSKIQLEEAQFISAVVNSSTRVIPSSSVNPRPHTHQHMYIEVEKGGQEHGIMFMEDFEHDSDVFVGMKDPITWERAQELLERELEGFGDDVEQACGFHQPEIEDEDLTIPATLGSEFRSSEFDEEEYHRVRHKFSEIPASVDWCPFESKTMCLLDLFDQLLHLRLSRRHMEMLIWILEEVGACDVLSLYAMPLTQQKLHAEGPGIPTERFESSLGNVMHSMISRP